MNAAKKAEGEMIRTFFSLVMPFVNRIGISTAALSAGLSAAFMTSASLAGVHFSYESAPTLGLPGYTTFTVMAKSDFANQPIAIIDFIGDPADNDPDTARGFFGPMHQQSPAGLPTVFTDAFDSTPDSELVRKQDSHFLFNT